MIKSIRDFQPIFRIFHNFHLFFKENESQFTESDVSIFEAFAIFCGLGIHNTQMYENACKLMAKQKVFIQYPINYFYVNF